MTKLPRNSYDRSSVLVMSPSGEVWKTSLCHRTGEEEDSKFNDSNNATMQLYRNYGDNGVDVDRKRPP